MEGLKKILTKSGWISIIEDLVLIIIGILLIQHPEGSMKVISFILGGLSIASGLYYIIANKANTGKFSLIEKSGTYGIMLIVIGIIMIIFHQTIMTLVGLILGIWIIYSALLRIGASVKLKKLVNSNLWIVTLVIALLMIVCGIVVIANATNIAAIVGIIIIVNSVFDIIENIIFLNTINEY